MPVYPGAFSEESTTPDLVELARRMFAATNDRDLYAEIHLYARDAVLDVTRTVGIVVRGRATFTVSSRTGG
jgi:hypothetical protein